MKKNFGFLRRMPRTGPDSLQSWLVVIYCSLLSMLLYGVVRLSGIMFVASMERFQVGRLSASMPYILCDFLQAMAGPITGFLSLKFGVRQVMILGALIAAIGTGACFFAENIETVIVLWGIVYGFGFGLSSLLLPVVITQHFVKRRATAIGLMFFGSYVGFSFLPSIADLLIHTYGLSGTYLFLSGFLLHCVPLSMLLQNPDTGQIRKQPGAIKTRANSVNTIDEYPPQTAKDSNKNDEILQDIKNSDSKNTNNEMNIKEKEAEILNSVSQYKIEQQDIYPKRCSKLLNCEDLQSIMESNADKHWIQTENIMNENNLKYDLNSEKVISDINQTERHGSNQRSLSRIKEGFSDDGVKKSDAGCLEIQKKYKYIENQTGCTETDPKLLRFKRIRSSSIFFMNPTLQRCYTVTPYNKDHDKGPNESHPVFGNARRTSLMIGVDSFFKRSINDRSQTGVTSTISKQKLPISRSLTIFLEPIFLLVLLGEAVYASSFITFITVVVDFTMDIGMSESDGKYVIMVFSIASNIGLLSFGWVTDGGFLSLTNFAALMLLLRTVTLYVFPYSNGFGMVMTIACLQGFFEASLANMFPLIVAEYYIDEIHELAISCILFFCGPLYLVTPLLIGFFRDGFGSYLYLFILMGSMSLTCSILLLLAPVLAKCRCGREDWILRKG